MSNVVNLHKPAISIDDVLDSVIAGRDEISDLIVITLDRDDRIKFGHTDKNSVELLGLLEVCKSHILDSMREYE